MPKIAEATRAARREQIIAAGLACFARSGYHATTMADVATQAGVSKGTPYLYFAGKEALFLALHEEWDCGAGQRVNAAIAALPEGDRGSPRRVLHAIAAGIAAHVTAEPATCRVLMEARALAAHEPAIAAAVRAADTRTYQQLEELIAAGVSAGEWPDGTDPALAARLFTAGLYGLMAQWHLAPGSFSWADAAAALAGNLAPADGGGQRRLSGRTRPDACRPCRLRRVSMTQKTGPQPDGCRAEGLTSQARQVHRAVLAAFARTGQPLARGELEHLARSLGASPDAVLGELAKADVIAFNAGGEIRAAYPFSPVRTPIRVSWPGGPAAYAMCAIDALGMSAMLGHPVTITAAEPGTGRTITVHADGSQTRWHPRTTVVFAGSAGDASCPSADRSCGYISFFATARAARAWARRHPAVTGRLLTQDGALGIGIAEFGSLLHAAPRPGTQTVTTRSER